MEYLYKMMMYVCRIRTFQLSDDEEETKRVVRSSRDKRSVSSFYSTRNASIASAVLATAIQSVRLSVCLSVRPSVTRRYCVKTTARSTVQFAPLDSKICLVL